MSFETEVEADSPRVWWDTRQAVGTSQPDRSGNGHTGTIVNAPTSDADGLHFNGTDQGVAGDDVILSGTTAAFTLEAVFQHQGDFSDVLDEPIMVLRDDTFATSANLSGNKGFTDTSLFGDYNDGTNTANTSVSPVEPTQRHHLVVQWDGAELHLFVDGTLVSLASGATPTFGDLKLYIGTDGTGTTDTFGPYAGLVEHAIFYDHDLGPARIAIHAAAAGGGAMALTADSQFEIRSTVFGAGEGNVWIVPEQIQGILGVPDPKTSDVDLWGQPGAVGNPEYPGVRLITIPVLVLGNTPADAVAAMQTLATAWATSTTDIELQIQLGGVVFTVNGRPRGAKDDLKRLKESVIDVILRFDALNPAVAVA